jgi:hypothetical protein
MNCDQVFDVLTRGPFPTGTACDPPVEAHLSVCPECRRLAEALRPALELFQEAIGPEESRDLPGYWCAVTADRPQPAVSIARDVAPRRAAAPHERRTPLMGNFSALAAWRLAAALALGVMLGSLVSGRLPLEGFSALPPANDEEVPSAPPDDDNHLQFTPAQHKMLAALPAACFGYQSRPAPKYTVSTPQLLAKGDLGTLNCCTGCHNTNSDSVTNHATAAVSQACQICHQEKSLTALD